MQAFLRVLTESNKSRFHSYIFRNGVLMISHLPFGIVSCTFFPTTLNSRNSCIWTGSVSSCSLSPFSLLIDRSWAAVSIDSINNCEIHIKISSSSDLSGFYCFKNACYIQSMSRRNWHYPWHLWIMSRLRNLFNLTCSNLSSVIQKSLS